MITYYTGNILNDKAIYIIQQVNCKGKMGSGLAKAIREKYPIVYTEYRNFYDSVKDKTFLHGKIQLIPVESNRVIIPWKIGCGLGDGDWDNDIYPMIIEQLNDKYNIKFWPLKGF